MASRDDGGQGGQLGRMREGAEEEEPASNQHGQAVRALIPALHGLGLDHIKRR